MRITEGFTVDTQSFEKPGMQTVTISYQNTECKYTVRVLEPVKKIELVPLPSSIGLTDSPKLSVDVYPSFAQSPKLIWSSSDENVLTVSEDGTVIARKRGSAEVTASTDDGLCSSTITITVDPKTFKTTWLVDDTATEIYVDEGSTIPKPNAPTKAGYTFKGWTPEVPAVMPASDLTFTAQFEQITLTKIAVKTAPTKTTYNVGESFDQSGLTLTATYSDGSTKTITSGFACVGFSSAAAGEKAITVTYEGKTATFSVTVVNKNPDPIIKIHNFTSSRTVDYRTTITFSVDEIQNPVAGASVHWFIDGQDKGASDTYTVKEAKQTFTVQAKYMKDGKVLVESEEETVNVNAGFFARLKAFFRALFKKLPVVAQEYLGVEIIDRVLP